MTSMKEWMINRLEIENFKSIKKQSINPKRINVFIGKPNVGKSNILEAISLLGGNNSALRSVGNQNEKFMSEYVRYERYYNLFYDNDRAENVLINSNLGFFFSRYFLNSIGQYELIFGHDFKSFREFIELPKEYTLNQRVNDFLNLRATRELVFPEWVQAAYTSIDDKGRVNDFGINENRYTGNIKRYDFQKNLKFTNRFSAFLNPPFGNNIPAMLESNPRIFDEIAGIFEQYGLELLLNQEETKLEVQKKIGRRTYKIPYTLSADTLQRYIFHLLAIKTNDQSVIVLEEPEAHSYPKYIVQIANEIIENTNNQYFIATHSPYLLTDFIEKCETDELGLYICDFKNYETVIRELSREEISNIKETGIDLFYNLNAFQD